MSADEATETTGEGGDRPPLLSIFPLWLGDDGLRLGGVQLPPYGDEIVGGLSFPATTADQSWLPDPLQKFFLLS